VLPLSCVQCTQIDVFHQLLSAVQYLHDHGRVHLDMKPQNVVQVDRWAP
jgi:serine/threonine protein kinase